MIKIIRMYDFSPGTFCYTDTMKRKIRRRIASFLLLISTVSAFILPAGPVKAEQKKAYAVSGGKIYADENGVIVGADVSVTEADIPERIGDITVTAIGKEAFFRCTKLKRIVLPETVERIGSFPFEGCINLESIEIGNRDLLALALPGDPGGGLDDEEEGRSRLSWYAFYGVGPAIYGHDFEPSYKESSYYRKLSETEPSGDYRRDVMEIARSQLGYREGFSPDHLDGHNRKDYVTPEGVTSKMQYEFGHYTEMSRLRGIQGTTWCAAFVYWCYAMAGVPDDIVGAGVMALPKEQRNTFRALYWNDLVYAGKGGTVSIEPGDILHLGKSHYALAKEVSSNIAGDRIRITYIEGNGNDRDVDEDFIIVDAATGESVEGPYDLDHVDVPDFSKIKEHALKLDPCDGTGSVTERRIAERSFYGVLPEPQREGYDFDGWYTSKEGGEKVLPYTRFTGTADQTIYARWMAGSFSESYKGSQYYVNLKKVKPTGDLREDILSVARSQIGYHEGNTESDLSGSDPYGEEDYTEYGRYLDTNGTAWCTEFITWCARMAQVPESVIGNANCASVKRFCAPYKTWQDTIYAGGSYRLKKGDLILLDWEERDPGENILKHSAFFYGARRVDEDTVAIRLLEGNSDNMVMTEVMTVEASSGIDVEMEPDEDGNYLHIAAIITPEYEK